ncbi:MULTISPECIES: triose-phosphate isomerase [Haloferax]|uniref:Triosephosphate isomerase n=2 Tax=Haloferax gibbonsii TaxID=35746 RepID=A0A0K1IUG2_HALGI|nr:MULTISPECIES: triose-phosphate isomerase [Haloferax]AKU08101.1 triosephosphate isomerase [Haloferax gibbonsii]ELZ79982.1 triosephosphate isomerase [Haloferax gibbonsii ATCC 33959]QOS12797.1 triosephosphate isomerase [Haloferax gibbonsii]RDZ52753.1 triose-phosphate isomerase [Haloferax sp. Atlit-4N]REA02079.1 triose-phosphate isomerase [Haloferax sp. Atlit-6N]
MNLPYPHFQVNFKVYPDTSGEDALAFARMLETIEAETDARFVLTPQLPDIRLITEHTDLAVTAPAMDAVEPGRGMGKILPETVADAGADGVVINHAENRDTLSDLVWKIERCRDLDLDSVVCVDSIEMGRAVAEFDPDSMIYEMPEDISSDRAITQTHPDRVRAFMSMVEAENPRTRVLVGGGISTAEDVRLAFEQGGHATGAASAVSLASDPESLLRDIAASFP